MSLSHLASEWIQIHYFKLLSTVHDEHYTLSRQNIRFLNASRNGGEIHREEGEDSQNNGGKFTSMLFEANLKASGVRHGLIIPITQELLKGLIALNQSNASRC